MADTKMGKKIVFQYQNIYRSKAMMGKIKIHCNALSGVFKKKITKTEEGEASFQSYVMQKLKKQFIKI